MPLGLSAIKCVEKGRQKTLRKNPLTCISNQMSPEKLLGKLAFEGHHPEFETLPQLGYLVEIIELDTE